MARDAYPLNSFEDFFDLIDAHYFRRESSACLLDNENGHRGKLNEFYSLLIPKETEAKEDVEARAYQDLSAKALPRDRCDYLLKEHNKRLYERLKTAGIKADLALGYPKIEELSLPDKGLGRELSETEEVQLWQHHLEKVLFDLFYQIYREQHQATKPPKEYLDEEPEPDEPKLAALDKLSKLLARLLPAQGTYLSSSWAPLKFALEEVKTHLLQMQADKNYSQPLSKEFSHDSQAFINRYDEILKLARSLDSHSPTQSFYLRQWNKADPHSFFLGSFFDEHLGPGYANFIQMVKRVFDDSCVFHTLHDKETDEPLAVAWLYLAERKGSAPGTPVSDLSLLFAEEKAAAEEEKPEALYVVADSIQFRTDLKNNRLLKDYLLKALLAYTEQYTQDIGAQGFFIAPLNSFLPTFLGYRKEDFNFKLVGNNLDLRSDDERDISLGRLSLSETYGLTSLKKTEKNTFFTLYSTKMNACPEREEQEEKPENTGRALNSFEDLFVLIDKNYLFNLYCMQYKPLGFNSGLALRRFLYSKIFLAVTLGQKAFLGLGHGVDTEISKYARDRILPSPQEQLNDELRLSASNYEYNGNKENWMDAGTMNLGALLTTRAIVINRLLQPLPPGLPPFLACNALDLNPPYRSSYQQAFEAFDLKLQTQGLDRPAFYEKYQLELLHLSRLMDEGAFPFLEKIVGISYASLESFLTQLPIFIGDNLVLVRTLFFDHFQKEALSQDKFHYWQNLLLLYGQFFKAEMGNLEHYLPEDTASLEHFLEKAALNFYKSARHRFFIKLRDDPLLKLLPKLVYPGLNDEIRVINDIHPHYLTDGRERLDLNGEDKGLPQLLEAYCSLLPARKSEAFKKAYLKFKATFIRVNQGYSEEDPQYRDFSTFFTDHFFTFYALFLVMQEDAFAFLGKYIAHSSMALERFIKNFNHPSYLFCVFLQEIFKSHRELLLSEKGYRLWETLLTTLSANLQLKDDEQAQAYENDLTALKHAYEVILTESKGLDELSESKAVDPAVVFKRMGQATTRHLFREIFDEKTSLPDDFDLNEANARLPSGALNLLLSEISKMKGDHYFSIFKAMLACDLTGKSFKAFCHDAEQNPQLAAHNAAIQKQLEDAGIDANLALNYPQRLESNYSSAHSASKEDSSKQAKQWWQTLGTYLANLLEETQHECALEKEKKDDPDEKKLSRLTYLKNILMNVLPKDTADYSLLSDLKNRKSLTLISSTLLQLSQPAAPFKRPLAGTFNEFSRHFSEHFGSLRSTSTVLTALSSKEKDIDLDFYVCHWNKDHPHTSYLGNYVSCCLAAGSTQFRALVQRRMDDGLFFHVLVDKKSELPLALSWLFFAEEKDKPGPVFVVSNFMEIHISYKFKDGVRDAMVKALLDFTRKYVKDIKAEGFLLAPLNYGSIPDHQGLPRQQRSLQKLGGCLKSQSHYYLKSLNRIEALNEKNEAVLIDPSFYEGEVKKEEKLILLPDSPLRTSDSSRLPEVELKQADHDLNQDQQNNNSLQ